MGNGLYIIILVLCIIGGVKLKKLKLRKKKNDDKKKTEDDYMIAVQKEVQRQLELAKSEKDGNEGDINDEDD